MGRMTKEDDAFQSAIIDQINAELGASGISMKQLAVILGKPYDSTRNYLKKERSMPLGFFLEIAGALNIDVTIIMERAKQRLER